MAHCKNPALPTKFMEFMNLVCHISIKSFACLILVSMKKKKTAFMGYDFTEVPSPEVCLLSSNNIML